jgi:integrase
MTVNDVARDWHTAIRGAVADATHRTYGVVVHAYITGSPLGAMDPRAVRVQDVRAFLLDMRRRYQRAATYVRLMQSITGMVFDHAVDLGVLRANPARGCWKRIPPELKIRFEPERFTPVPGAASAILTHMMVERPELGRIVATYRDTGCRRNEALGLQADDLDFARHTIVIRRQWFGRQKPPGPPKGRRPRTVDMSTALEAVLHAALEESDMIARRLGCPPSPRWVFRSALTGVPFHPVFVGRAIGTASLEIGPKRVSPKGFRHAVATRLLHDGESPRYVQLLLGHAHLSTTMQYVANTGIRRRAAVDGLGNL